MYILLTHSICYDITHRLQICSATVRFCSKGRHMGNTDQESTFRRRARKTARGIMLVNIIGTIVVLVGIIALLIWLAQAA